MTDVIGVDITTSGISVARYTVGATPRVAYPDLPPATDYTVAATRSRAAATAAMLVDGITSGGPAALVVLNKPTAGDMRSDPSGARRVGLWWEIAARFLDAGFPVAQAPPLLAALKLVQNAPAGGFTDTHAKIGVRLRDLWPDLRYPADEGFRPACVLYAVAGAMTLGLETPIKRTPARDKVLRLMSLPADLAAPAAETSDAATPSEVAATTGAEKEIVR